MKKLVLLVASSLVALMLTSCGEQTPKQPEPTTTEQAQPAEEPAKVEENKVAEPTATEETKAAADAQTQE